MVVRYVYLPFAASSTCRGGFVKPTMESALAATAHLAPEAVALEYAVIGELPSSPEAPRDAAETCASLPQPQGLTTSPSSRVYAGQVRTAPSVLSPIPYAHACTPARCAPSLS